MWIQFNFPDRQEADEREGQGVQEVQRAAMTEILSANSDTRFWAKVDKSAGPSGCWLYMGFRKWDGYGWLQRYVGGKPRSLTAHRYAWILTHGEPEKGLSIMHECDNPPCCNPAHLRLGTHKDNMADCRRKGRHNSGALKNVKPVLHPNRVRPRRQHEQP